MIEKESADFKKALQELNVEAIIAIVLELPPDWNLDEWSSIRSINEEYVRRTGKSPRYVGLIAHACKVVKHQLKKIKIV